MTESSPASPAHYGGPAPIEKKVKASTVSAGAIVALLTTVLSVVENDQLVEGLPDWVPVLLATLISAGTTFAAGRSAPHTARPDLPRAER